MMDSPSLRWKTNQLKHLTPLIERIQEADTLGGTGEETYEVVYETRYPKLLGTIMRVLFPTIPPQSSFSYSLGFPEVESTFARTFLERMELRKETLPCHYVYLTALESLIPLMSPEEHGMVLLDLFRTTDLVLHGYCVRHNIGEIFSSLACGYYLSLSFEHSFDYISTGCLVIEKILSLIQSDLQWTPTEVSKPAT